jgi:putative membrane protein
MKTISKKITGAFVALLLSMALITACKDDNNDVEGTNATDDQFIIQAGWANNAEISAAQLALSKSTNDSVRAFATMMVADHTAAKNQLIDIADDLNRSVPDTADLAHQAVMVVLNGLSGARFDSAYVATQILDHQTAITLFQNEVDDGENDRLIDYAAGKLPALNTHLARVFSIVDDIIQ